MRRAAESIVLVTAGTLVLAFSVAAFILPFDLVSGGVTGFSIALYHLLPNTGIPAESLVALLGWLLFFVGLFSFGWRFAAKTLCATALYPIALSALLRMTLTGRLTDWTTRAGETGGLLLAAVLGGLLMGLGCALTIKGGGSTGGSDVLVLLACRALPRLGRGRAFFLLDLLVIAFGFFVLREPVHAFCSVVSAFSGAVAVGAVL